MTNKNRIKIYLMAYDKKVKEERKMVLDKVVGAFLKNKKLMDEYFKDRNKHFNVQSLSNLACDHLFDDYPERFGISKHEGHVIREYFHEKRPYEYSRELRKYFPKVFEKERKEYIKNINFLKRHDSLTLRFRH